MKQADEKQKLLKDIRRKFLRNAELSTIKSEAINSESRSFHTLAIATIFLAIGGLALAILGYRDWYMRVQKPLDEKLRLEIEQLKKPKAPY